MQKTVSANSKGIQRINRLRVLDLIRSGNLVARSAICERTGLSAASVSNIVSYLIENGLVKEANCENVSRSGRKSVLLRFAVENYRLITVSHIGSMLYIFRRIMRRICASWASYGTSPALNIMDITASSVSSGMLRTTIESGAE